MNRISKSGSGKDRHGLAFDREAAFDGLSARLEESERSRESLIREKSELESRIALAEARARRLHESYLKRLENQTQSTALLSETVDSILDAVEEMSNSYKEMSLAVQDVAATCRQLGESFEAQAGIQSDISRRTQSVDSASESEVRKARELKDDLGHLEAIRSFMAKAMDTIADVSDRLSLLSMNGRIEAAHAGAAGRGFAVVAQEMLNLQRESDRVITAQKTQLGEFLPLMAGMRDKSDDVESRAREQQSAIRGIAEGSRTLDERTVANKDFIAGLGSAVEELAAAIEQGKKTTHSIDEKTDKVKEIFSEEVFVSQKVNSIDRFLFEVAAKSGSVAEAGHALVNEYQKMSVLDGKSYVWQAECWLATEAARLPPDLSARAAGLGKRVLVCIGQTDDNKPFPQALDARSGILALRSIDDISDRSSPLQAVSALLDRIGLKVADLKDPGRIDHSRSHGGMAVIEDFEGDYERAMRDAIRRGNLVTSFSFGGAFPNGDAIINLFLSTFKRHQSDAVKFGMIGESMTLAFQSLVENGVYWR